MANSNKHLHAYAFADFGREWPNQKFRFLTDRTCVLQIYEESEWIGWRSNHQLQIYLQARGTGGVRELGKRRGGLTRSEGIREGNANRPA